MKKVLFLGSKGLGVNIFESLCTQPGITCAAITIDDRSDSRSAFESLARVASDRSVPFHVARDRLHAEAIVRAESPDLCVVACWYWLFSGAVLGFVPQGFIGIHNSLLPKYRGGAPLIWALLNGDPEVGASYFTLREGMDDGPIWMQARVPVGAEDYVGDVIERLDAATLEAFRVGFPDILAGTLQPLEQDHADATFCAQRIPDDGEIDWSQPADKILRFIRAQSRPYPGAFTFLKGDRVTIFRAGMVPTPFYGTPGQLARLDGDRAVAVCGDASALTLDEVELKGESLHAHHVMGSLRGRFPRHSHLSASRQDHAVPRYHD